MKLLIIIISILGCSKDIKRLSNKYKNIEEYWKYIKEDKDIELEEFLSKEENEYINLNNEMDEEGEIALTLTIKYNSIRVTNFLLANQSIDFNSENCKGQTALTEASRYGNIELVKFFLEKGADVNHKTKYGCTPLIIASINGYVEIVRLLIEKGAKVNYDMQETALTAACRYGHIEIVELLLEKDSNVNGNSTVETPLMEAAGYGHTEVVRLLLKSGADVNCISKKGYTALMYASINGYIEVVKLLLEEKANVNYKNNKGYTALMYASKYGHVEIARYIIKKVLQDYEELNKVLSKKPKTFINKEDIQREINRDMDLLKSLLSLPSDMFNLIIKYI